MFYFSGWLYTQTGSYQVPFFICGAILFIAACLVSLARRLVQPALGNPVLTLPDEIVISPVDENSGDLVPVQNRHSNRILSARACSVIDLAVEVYAENYSRSSSAYLAVSQDHFPRGLGVRNRKDGKVCSQDVLNADDSTAIYHVENEYTDIANQISGMMKTGHTCFSTNQNEGLSRQLHNNDVIVSVPANQNAEFSHQRDNNCVMVSDGHVSDTSSVDYGDNNVFKRSSSGMSIDDAGYFSSAAPATYVDSDTQSATSQCGVSVSIGSKKGSCDSLVELDFIENEKFNDEGYFGNTERFESVGMLGKIARVYE